MSRATGIRIIAIGHAVIIIIAFHHRIYGVAAGIAFFGIMVGLANIVAVMESSSKQQ